ncbi:MAG TPA: GAF domain-containing sensor histidine kinase [Pyrinomonadaceae bacterium]|nr:GAF domain-containing sensor histidine kinase [Pyrinomonadaceae bacterium]
MPDDYAEAVNGFEIGANSLACGLATHTGEAVLTTDVQTDPRWGPWRWMAEHFDYRGCWSFPITTVAGKFVGTLAMYLRQPQEPTHRDLELASLLTNTASIIISRHKDSEVRIRAEQAQQEYEAQLRSLNEVLEERVRDRTRELQAEVHERRAGEERIKNLLRKLVSAEEEQRRRIARELHDTFGQQLAALHMTIEVLKSKTDGDRSVRENIERMREAFDRLNSSVDFLAWELRPPSLDLLGLDAALESYVTEWSRQFGVEAVYEGVAVSGLRLAAEAETNLYRIFQEALQNVHKHAGADRVNVVFERRDGQAVLIIEDNGKGYDSEEQTDGRGMGLINMRERAALIGGTVEIESQPGEGTTVFVRVPVKENGNK